MSTKKILTVMLDTEVLKRDPWRKKGPFLALNNLAKAKNQNSGRKWANGVKSLSLTFHKARCFFTAENVKS
jgi:hypothetical protein